MNSHSVYGCSVYHTRVSYLSQAPLTQTIQRIIPSSSFDFIAIKKQYLALLGSCRLYKKSGRIIHNHTTLLLYLSIGCLPSLFTKSVKRSLGEQHYSNTALQHYSTLSLYLGILLAQTIQFLLMSLNHFLQLIHCHSIGIRFGIDFDPFNERATA